MNHFKRWFLKFKIVNVTIHCTTIECSENYKQNKKHLTLTVHTHLRCYLVVPCKCFLQNVKNVVFPIALVAETVCVILWWFSNKPKRFLHSPAVLNEKLNNYIFTIQTNELWEFIVNYLNIRIHNATLDELEIKAILAREIEKRPGHTYLSYKYICKLSQKMLLRVSIPSGVFVQYYEIFHAILYIFVSGLWLTMVWA